MQRPAALIPRAGQRLLLCACLSERSPLAAWSMLCPGPAPLGGIAGSYKPVWAVPRPKWKQSQGASRKPNTPSSHSRPWFPAHHPPTRLCLREKLRMGSRLPSTHAGSCQTPRLLHSPATTLRGLRPPTPPSSQTGSSPRRTAAGCCTWYTSAWPCCARSRSRHPPTAQSSRAALPCPAEEAGRPGLSHPGPERQDVTPAQD